VIIVSLLNLSQEDIDLKLLRGDAFQVGKFVVHPVTLNRIVDIGYRNFSSYLGVVTAEIKDILDSSVDPEIVKEYALYDIYVHSNNEELLELFVNGLSWFLGEDPNDLSYVPDFGLVYGGIEESIDQVRLIDKKNFAEIVEIIKLQCGMNGSLKNTTYKASNAKAQEIIEKINKGREIVDKHTKKSTDEIRFVDIISAVAAKSNSYTLLDIWTLTLPQFYNAYKRLEKISSYEVGILASVNGAKVDLKHWSSQI